MTMTTIRTRPWDTAEHLKSEESIAHYLGEAMDTGDAAYIQHAISTVARARGMAQIAEDAGLQRESLYKALRPDSKPQFGTILKVFGALGVKLVVEPVASARVEGKTFGRKPVRKVARKVRKVPTTHAEAFQAKAAPAKRSSKRQATGG